MKYPSQPIIFNKHEHHEHHNPYYYLSIFTMLNLCLHSCKMIHQEIWLSPYSPTWMSNTDTVSPGLGAWKNQSSLSVLMTHRGCREFHTYIITNTTRILGEFSMGSSLLQASTLLGPLAIVWLLHPGKDSEKTNHFSHHRWEGTKTEHLNLEATKNCPNLEIDKYNYAYI